jgi:shikimate 5-dehydrogenase/shikimate kinase
MAAAIVGSKRSFAAMNGNGAPTMPIVTNAGPEALTSHLRKMTSVEGTRTSLHSVQGCHALTFVASVNSSVKSTPRNTPAPTTQQEDVQRNFEPDASIVLIGMRGTGKSTLAVIASIACRRRVVDIDDLFQEATGFSSARYRKQFGAANHNLRQEELLQTTLRLHDLGAIIICNGGSLERNGQALMQEFAKSHPVVHVVRDLQSIHHYLGGIDLHRLKDMLAFTAPILRRCSNYEFSNVAEMGNTSALPSTPTFLTLKRAQRTFLKFLSLITSSKDANSPVGTTIPPLEPGYPLSDVATELRKHTCSVQVPLSDLLAEDVNIQNLENGSDAFEVVVDPPCSVSGQLTLEPYTADDISTCISKVRRSTVVPIILHVLPTSSTGGAMSSYLELVHHGLRTAPEFMTVDLSLGEEILMGIMTSKGNSKIIGHLHTEKTWDDPSWITHYDTAVRLGCALVRFSRSAEATEDDYFLHKLRYTIKVRQNSIPLTCLNTGKAGRRSACLGQHFTPVIAPLARKSPAFTERVQYNPQTPWITAREATQALYASFTFDPMQVYIIGASLGYSVSPAMHNAAYKSCGMPHRFNRVQSSSLNSLKELVRDSNFGGSIVIQPYKVEVISLTDSLSQHARAIGAVNTLIPVRHLRADNSVPSDLELFEERNQSGPVQALYGDNTEWIGIRSCVRRGLSPANAVRPSSCGLVIGAGGMARAAVYALLQLGVTNIVIFNRTIEKAERLAAHFTRLVSSTVTKKSQGPLPNFHVLKTRNDEWPESFRQPTIVLSCIPADPIDGGPAAHFTLPVSWMRSATGGVVMEIAYKTLNTPLKQQMRAEPAYTYMDGLDFLPEQAFAQFELFCGKRAPRRVMREEVLRAWRDEQGNANPEMVERRLKAIDDQEP